MVALPQVTLLPGSLYSDARDRNLAFQLSLDNENILDTPKTRNEARLCFP